MGSKPPKAKKIMLDFDECFYFVIITSQVQKRVHSGKRPGSFGLVEEQEGAVSDAGETGQRKFLCVPATNTQAERVFSWMGFLLNKRRLSLSGESVTMQLFLKDNLEL